MKEMKLLTRIGAWLRTWQEQRRKRMAERHNEELKQEAERVLQVREFEGRLFVCYNEVPLLTTCMLSEDLPLVVDAARLMYVEYYKTKESWHRK